MLQIELLGSSIVIALLLIPISLILFYVSRNRLGKAKKDVLYKLSLPLLLHLFALPYFASTLLWDFLLSKPFGNSSFFSMYGSVPDSASYYYEITSLALSLFISCFFFVFGVLIAFRKEKHEYVKLIFLAILSIIIAYMVMFHRNVSDYIVFMFNNNEVSDISALETVVIDEQLSAQQSGPKTTRSYWLERDYLGNLYLSQREISGDKVIEVELDRPYNLVDSIVRDGNVFVTATLDGGTYALHFDLATGQSKVIFSNEDYNSFQNALVSSLDASGTRVAYDLVSCIGCEATYLGKAIYNLDTNEYRHITNISLFEWNETASNGYRYKKIPGGCEYYFKSPFGRETKNQDCEFKLNSGQWFE